LGNVQEREQELIARVERAENDAFLTLYRAARNRCGTGWCEIDGVLTVWSPHDDDPGFSCIINLADAAAPEATLATIEDAARADGATVLGIDGSPAAVAAIGEERLAAMGFTPEYQECMWGRWIGPEGATAAGTPERPEPRIELATDRDRETFARVLNIGYDIPADAIRGHLFASTIGQPGWWHYLVHYDGEPGSASVLYVTEGVAQLFVATTMPAFRGRGGQTALIRRRLTDAIAAGCDAATSQTVVDNASPRNMARYGFHPLYHRWIYGKQLDSSAAAHTSHSSG
jgi:hypothetical protein